MAKDKRSTVYYDRDNRQFMGISESQLNDLKSIYKGVDVEVEIKKMCLWLESPKGKKRKGDIGFILNWLNNTTPTKAMIVSVINADESLTPMITSYLRELWKGKEHLLLLNTGHR